MQVRATALNLDDTSLLLHVPVTGIRLENEAWRAIFSGGVNNYWIVEDFSWTEIRHVSDTVSVTRRAQADTAICHVPITNSDRDNRRMFLYVEFRRERFSMDLIGSCK